MSIVTQNLHKTAKKWVPGCVNLPSAASCKKLGIKQPRAQSLSIEPKNVSSLAIKTEYHHFIRDALSLVVLLWRNAASNHSVQRRLTIAQYSITRTSAAAQQSFKKPHSGESLNPGKPLLLHFLQSLLPSKRGNESNGLPRR